MAVVRILGVDPGTVVVGFGCLEVHDDEAPAGAALPPLALRGANTVRAGGRGRVRVVEVGALRLGPRGRPLPERLGELARHLRGLVARLLPDEIALEEAFQGKSVQSGLRIGEARGVVLAESAQCRLPVHQFAPARIKRCITGQGTARKETVAAMLRHLLGSGLDGRLPADATDALAVAMTRAEERRAPLVQAGARRGRWQKRRWPVPPG